MERICHERSMIERILFCWLCWPMCFRQSTFKALEQRCIVQWMNTWTNQLINNTSNSAKLNFICTTFHMLNRDTIEFQAEFVIPFVSRSFHGCYCCSGDRDFEKLCRKKIVIQFEFRFYFHRAHRRYV